MAHPYKELPASKFWSRSVILDFDAADTYDRSVPLIRMGEMVMSAGSCFAAELVPYLERCGLSYLRTEYQGSFYRNIPPENLSYGRFSAGYGNIYTARQLLQLFLRSQGKFRPREDRWLENGIVVDPFRPGLRYPARGEREFEILTSQHLAATAEAFRRCDVLIFTLGLTEAWISTIDGAVFPACPGTIAGKFDSSKHKFHNFATDEIVSDLNKLIRMLRTINPKVRLILTVSPVPLVATASDNHVLVATTYSKSVLRVAAEEVVRENAAVRYFPSYEIVTGPQAPDRFFKPDRRSVSREAIDTVIDSFLRGCNFHKDDSPVESANQPTAGRFVEAATPSAGPSVRGTAASDFSAELSARIAKIECEEAGAEI